MTKTEINYDLSSIDQITETPTVGDLITVQKQLVKV